MAAISLVHCSKINESGTPDSKRPPETGGLCIPEDKSFGSD
jgi:hypothetical protein